MCWKIVWGILKIVRKNPFESDNAKPEVVSRTPPTEARRKNFAESGQKQSKVIIWLA